MKKQPAPTRFTIVDTNHADGPKSLGGSYRTEAEAKAALGKLKPRPEQNLKVVPKGRPISEVEARPEPPSPAPTPAPAPVEEPKPAFVTKDDPPKFKK